MKKSILLSVALLTLGGCVSHDFGEGKRTNYSCDGDKEFSSREVAGTVEVYASGQTHRLFPTSEGVYSSGGITLKENWSYSQSSPGTSTVENSRQRKRLPGRNTRYASRNAASIRGTLRMPNAMV